MDEKRNKVIVGVVVVVVLVGLIFFFASGSSVKCDLQDVKPEFDLTKQQNVKSSNNKALVTFEGYLKYQKDEKDKNDTKVYLPLNFESVSYNEKQKEDNKTMTGTMTLTTNCATLNFNYVLSENRAALTVTEIDVTLVLPNGDFKSCKAQPTDMSRADPKKHYACETTKEYICETSVKVDNKDVKKTVATLVLGVFKFEVDGDPEKIKKLEFSTGEERCK